MSSLGGKQDPLLNGNQEKRPLLRDGTQSTAATISRREKSPDTAIIQIPLPAPERAEPRYKPEKCKTLAAFLFAAFNLILNLVVLAFVHERVPDRKEVPPLPDIFFDLFPAVDWALDVSEVIIIASVWTCILLMLLHRYRWIVFRRVFLIIGALYAMRAITMLVTQVPIASETYYCSPKANSTSPLIILKRVVQLFSGFGLSINGQHTYCGDYIFSGHTLILTLCYLIVQEYSPQRCKLLHLLYFFTSLTGIFMVLLARGHYLIDVVLGYYVTTRVFWIYHSLAAAQQSSKVSEVALAIEGKKSCGKQWLCFWRRDDIEACHSAADVEAPLPADSGRAESYQGGGVVEPLSGEELRPDSACVLSTISEPDEAHSVSQTAVSYLSRVWWYPLFRIFECNVTGPVPRQYEWPLPWPRRWLPRTRIS